MPTPKQGHPGERVAQVLVVLVWRLERAWFVAVSGRKPAPQVAVAAVAEAAKSAVRVPVVWMVLLDEVVDDVVLEEVVDEVVEEEVVDDVFLVEHKEGVNEQSVAFALSTIATAIALPIKAKRNTLWSLIRQFSK
ncbi:hypothetical protein BOTNAR_0298g00030 [Botryotinia narcissicola]|uniref:Uncharacterized protein n=1 Tax=Botryotinia narcissicola TaxID=278944 RepID=A0A4Z1HVR0_9HELO|nr:hypothetical protein BOTNAR_0298g00030 [Botryotinia narcissicola]